VPEEQEKESGGEGWDSNDGTNEIKKLLEKT
jgi:hypothetical protein